MDAERVDVPRAWTQVPVESLGGVLMVVGAPDVGKSTFARYVHRRLSTAGVRTAYLDGDPGQSTCGPPTTVSVTVGGDECRSTYRRFVGDISPGGHMLPLLTGVSHLVSVARANGAKAIVYDTSGLIEPSRGGLSLKLAKIDLLRPAVLFAIQRSVELEALLVPLRRSQRVRVLDLCPSPAVKTRDRLVRQAHRADQFARYFGSAQALEVDWSTRAVFPGPRFERQRLVALEDRDYLVLGLGIVLESDIGKRRVTLYTPVMSLDDVAVLHIGDVVLDLATFQDRRLVPGT